MLLLRSIIINGIILSLNLGLAAHSAAQQPGKNCAADSNLVVYLTFDDGPMESSSFIDSLILRDSVPVEVFLTGFRLEGNPVLQQKVEDYRKQTLLEMGNHSYSHAGGRYRLYYAEPAKVVEDVLKNADSLQLPLNIARLPGRNTWRLNGRKRTDLNDADPAADSLALLGYSLFGWDIEWRLDTCENRYYSADEIITQIKQMAASKKSFKKGHIIILCHDWALTDTFFREQLSVFVRQVRSTGIAKFAHLSSYPGFSHTIISQTINNL